MMGSSLQVIAPGGPSPLAVLFLLQEMAKACKDCEAISTSQGSSRVVAQFVGGRYCVTRRGHSKLCRFDVYCVFCLVENMLPVCD